MEKVISIFLALIMLFLTTLVVSAESEKPNFTDIEDVRQTINKIYDENFDEFESIAKKLKPSIGQDNKYFTYETNCGPCSTAFQKILYDNGIVVENQRPTISTDHVYNMLRTSYASSSDKETDIVIDTTYKQFLTEAYIDENYTYEDMALDLPNVLIYEYGNYEQLCGQLSALFDRFSTEKAEAYSKKVFEKNYYFECPISDFQHLESHNVMNYSSEFIEDLRSNSGKLSEKLGDTLIINSINSDLQKEFVYDINGIYRCYLTNQEIKDLASGFDVVNQNGERLYGANENTNSLYPPTYNVFDSNRNNYVQMLDANGEEAITITVTSSPLLDALMCIDLGSGTDTPSIYIIPISYKYSYGDANMDGTVNIDDVTYLQKSIAQCSGYSLSTSQLSIADVTKTGALSIKNATAISKKLAGLEDFAYGEKLYFSSSVRLGFDNTLGYIDF